MKYSQLLTAEKHFGFSSLLIMTGAFFLYGQLSLIGWLTIIGGIIWHIKKSGKVSYLNPDFWSNKEEGFYLLAIMGIALFLRIWQLNQLPPGCWFDEAENGLKTLSIINGELTFFNPRNNGSGTLYYYWCIPFFKLLGATPLALRSATVILSLISIILTWIFSRALFGKKIAIVAALIMATSSWHLVISRVGFDAMMALVFELLVLCVGYFAIRLSNIRLYIIAGFLLGLAQYGYTASRLTIVILPLFMIMISLYKKWLINKKGVAIAIIMFIVTIIPLVKIALKEPDLFWKRTGQVSIIDAMIKEKSLGVLLRNSRAALRMLHEKGDRNPRHHIFGKPMLNPIVGALLILGLIWAWKKKKNPMVIFLLIWPGLIILIGTILTRPTPHGLRVIAALAPISILSAIGFSYFLNRIKRSKSEKELVIICLAGIMTGMAGINYFKEYANNTALRPAFSSRAYEAGLLVKELNYVNRFYVSQSLSKSVVQFIGQRPENEIITFDPARDDLHLKSDVIILGYEEELAFYKKKDFEIIRKTNDCGEVLFILKNSKL